MPLGDLKLPAQSMTCCMLYTRHSSTCATPQTCLFAPGKVKDELTADWPPRGAGFGARQYWDRWTAWDSETVLVSLLFDLGLDS